MNKTSKSYEAGRDAFGNGLMYSDKPAMLNFTINWDEWQAGYIDALVAAVRKNG
jgi:hypothetical protein